MTISLKSNRYGKSSVNLMKLNQEKGKHTIQDLQIDILLKGDLADAFTNADNSEVVPTDTMKNTIYILAKKHDFDTIEEFGKILTSHFIDKYDQITESTAMIQKNYWDNIKTTNGLSSYGFINTKKFVQTCKVELKQGENHKINSGVKNLVVLKSTKSGFEDFHEDEYTTLEPTDDRILGTTITATWEYNDNVSYNSINPKIIDNLLENFAEHNSKSVQHTLYDMGENLLKEFTQIEKIYISMPNQHKLLADLSVFNLENDNEIFIPTEEPFGVIEATLERK